MFVFEESLFTLVSGLVVSAGMVGAVPTAALAQSIEAIASQPPVYLAQATDSEVLTDLEGQPSDPDDLALDSLTDEQIAQIEAIFETYQPQLEGAVADYLAALSVMNDLLVPRTADLALTDAHNNVVATEQVVNDLVFKRNLAIRSVLTLEQRQFVNDYVRAWLGIAPTEPVAVFPQNLVGTDANTTLANLQAEGWEVVFSTPGEIGLNRNIEALNLGISRNGEIIAAELLN